MMKKTLLAASLAALLAGCGGSGSKSEEAPVDPNAGKFTFEAAEMITNLSDDVIVTGYADLAAKAEALQLAVDALVPATSTQAELTAAQEAWKAARKPWEQGESHIFGPVDALSIDPHLDSWPLDTGTLQTILDSTSSFAADTIIGAFNDDVQGFHAMEYLLFGDGVADNEKSIIEMTQSEKDYLLALTQVFVQYTSDLDDAWQVSFNDDDGTNAYVERLKNTSTSGTYGSELAVVEELVNGLIGIVDEVGNGKIADPFGADVDSADTTKVESQYSWNSLTDFADNIVGVKNVWEGEFAGAADKQGLVDLVKAGDSALASRISNEIDTAIADIKAISGDDDMPFRQAILDETARTRIQTAVDSLAKLQASLESDVIPLLKNWNI